MWAGGALEADEEDVVDSGNWCMCPLPIREPVLHVELRLIWLFLRPGAFDGITPKDLSLALQHPLMHVRQAAFLSIGR